jgi:hypothetical protein
MTPQIYDVESSEVCILAEKSCNNNETSFGFNRKLHPKNVQLKLQRNFTVW